MQFWYEIYLKLCMCWLSRSIYYVSIQYSIIIIRAHPKYHINWLQSKINITTQNQMQDELVMNKLPLPKYFDGQQWNTVIKPSRKYIPKYLHDDLPALKHMYIKEKFKEIGKFNCPKLDYFDKMIKNKKPHGKVLEKRHSEKKNKKEISYNQLKQQLQYALIIADKDSNIVDNLLQKAKTCHRQLENLKQKKQNSSSNKQHNRKKNRRLSLARDTGKYFNNTVELVFKQRKKQFLDQMNAAEQIDTKEMQDRISRIKLISYDG